MADLLECVIQIKALEASVSRLEQLAGRPGAADDPRVEALARRLLEAEQRCVSVWRSGTHTRSTVTPSAVDEFIALRRAHLTVLQSCTAADLAGPVDWPGRGRTTVADLVAIMLANDTEVLGELRLLRLGDSRGG